MLGLSLAKRSLLAFFRLLHLLGLRVSWSYCRRLFWRSLFRHCLRTRRRNLRLYGRFLLCDRSGRHFRTLLCGHSLGASSGNLHLDDRRFLFGRSRRLRLLFCCNSPGTARRNLCFCNRGFLRTRSCRRSRWFFRSHSFGAVNRRLFRGLRFFCRHRQQTRSQECNR